jgi:hypothetical protein
MKSPLLALALAGSLASLASSTNPNGPNPTSGKGVHRTHTGTKNGKRMVGAKGARITSEPLSDHNKAIEEAYQSRLQARKARQIAQGKAK